MVFIINECFIGLFHRAIAESGSALNPWAFESTNSARARALRYAKALGANTEDSNELLQFFRNFTFQELLDGVAMTSTDFVSIIYYLFHYRCLIIHIFSIKCTYRLIVNFKLF